MYNIRCLSKHYLTDYTDQLFKTDQLLKTSTKFLKMTVKSDQLLVTTVTSDQLLKRLLETTVRSDQLLETNANFTNRCRQKDKLNKLTTDGNESLIES